MTELKLVGTLILTLIIQGCFIPFRIVAFVFSVIESVAKIIKETINHLIKLIQNEMLK